MKIIKMWVLIGVSTSKLSHHLIDIPTRLHLELPRFVEN